MIENVMLIFADSHLADRSWVDRAIEGDAYFSLEQITKEAVNLKVSAVIGAGDLFDRQTNRANPIAVFNQNIDRLQEAEIPFYFVQGQHDMQANGYRWPETHRWPVSLNNFTVGIGPYHVHGLDFTPSPLLQIALGSIPASATIGIFHQVWENWMGVGNPDGRFEEISSVIMGFSGDLHKTVKTKVTGRDGQELMMYSPGSTAMQDISEPPEKYFLVLRDDGTVITRKLKTRPFMKIGLLATPDEADQLMANIGGLVEQQWDLTANQGYPESVRAPLIRVVYPHFLGDIGRRLRAAVAGRGHVFEKELPPEKLMPQVSSSAGLMAADDADAGTAATLDLMLDEYVETQQIGGYAETCHRLLSSPDVPAELRKMRDEVLTQETADVQKDEQA